LLHFQFPSVMVGLPLNHSTFSWVHTKYSTKFYPFSFSFLGYITQHTLLLQFCLHFSSMILPLSTCYVTSLIKTTFNEYSRNISLLLILLWNVITLETMLFYCLLHYSSIRLSLSTCYVTSSLNHLLMSTHEILY
jgi:hypothetical protein